MGRSLFSVPVKAGLPWLWWNFTPLWCHRGAEHRSERWEGEVRTEGDGEPSRRANRRPLPFLRIELLGSEVGGLRRCRQRDAVGPGWDVQIWTHIVRLESEIFFKPLSNLINNPLRSGSLSQGWPSQEGGRETSYIWRVWIKNISVCHNSRSLRIDRKAPSGIREFHILDCYVKMHCK